MYGGAGPNTPANTTLVTAFYQNVLQRAPDAVGLAYWVGTGLPASTLLAAFAQSPEFINNTHQPIINFQNLEAAGTPVTTGSLFAVPGSTSAAVSALAAGAHADPAFAADPPVSTNDIVFQTVQTGARSNPNTHILDLPITNTEAFAGGAHLRTNDGTVSLHGSDIVHLTGVSLPSINGGTVLGALSNIHWVS